MSRVFSVGIDLGTTNTVCITLEKGKFECIKFKNKAFLPSVLLYKDGKITVGENAKKKAVLYAENYIHSAKTHLGDLNHLWQIEDQTFSATTVATEILKEVAFAVRKQFKLSAEDCIQAVITVPAYFTSAQVDETKKAGDAAGLCVERIITEPVAAAIAYGIEREEVGQLFVFDLGGGTLDVCILKATTDQPKKQFQTQTIQGDTHLGGDNFDTVILEYCLAHLRMQEGVDLSDFKTSGLTDAAEFANAKQRLLDAAETAKIELSSSESIQIDLPHLFHYAGEERHLALTLTRAQFNEEAAPLLKKIKRVTERCLEENQYLPRHIDKVILVGGSAYIPAIREYITQLFGTEKCFADKDLGKLVAMGAAILAKESSSIQETIEVHDILSHSLGIELANKTFAKILERNSPYPCRQSDIFTTTFDKQKSIQINVYEGEDEDNITNDEYYGGFQLEQIEQAKKGEPKIEVTFEFDKNRILHVTARDLKTKAKHTEIIEVDKKANLS